MTNYKKNLDNCYLSKVSSSEITLANNVFHQIVNQRWREHNEKFISALHELDWHMALFLKNRTDYTQMALQLRLLGFKGVSANIMAQVQKNYEEEKRA